MSRSFQELRAIFKAEAANLLDELTGLLEKLPKSRGKRVRSLVASCLRLAHNVKGSAVIAEFAQIEQLAHALEDALGPLKEADRPPSSDLVETMLDGAMAMQKLIETEKQLPEVDSLVTRLKQCGDKQDSCGTDGEADQPVAEEVASPQPQDDSSVEPEVIEAEDTGDDRARQTLVRVDSRRLDRVMALAGEMLLANARMSVASRHLEQLREEIEARLSELPDQQAAAWRSISSSLAASVHHAQFDERRFSRLTEDVNLAVKELRMIPLERVAPAWRKTIRESARSLGRKVRLILEGGMVEIDRSVLEKVREPVVHLLRNAVDHGIGEPAQRVQEGKPEEGTVLITATARGTTVRLEISDDGRGIDLQRVGEVAVARGLRSEGELARMSSNEVSDLVFAAGFSTAESVSRISGRGVGLDVLQRTVTDIGGWVELIPDGLLGGCTFAMTIPVSLLSRRGLLVTVGDSFYLLPIESVERCVRIRREALVSFDGAPMAQLADSEPVPVRWLGALMGVDHGREAGWLNMIIVANGSARLGLVADSIYGEEELVVKQLPWNLRGSDGSNGAAILADGSVALAVDIGFAFRQASTASDIASPPRPAGSARRPRILVADDSLTARTMQRNVLSAAGYEVTQVVDGAEAWQALREEEFELLVTDVQMPEIDGIELTRRVRADARLHDLPVILVTSLGRPEDIARGAESGADEYLVKGQYAQDELLQAVTRLL
jgi:two-component system chemotaxis sensor kinase CheA